MKHFNFIKGFLLALLFVFAAQVKAETYTVAEAFAAYENGGVKAATVKGYIVGVVDGSSVAKNSKFTAETEVATNLLLADNADETDPNNCLPVQLPKGAVREALNLVAHPENYGQFVALTGSIEKYFSVAGLKSVTEYSFEGAAPEQPETPEQPEEPEEPETPVEPETPAGVYISEALTSSFGTFTTQETVGNYPWEIATQYQCAKVTSYDSATKENHEATSWLISTPVDFTNETEAYVAFEYIIRYAESGKVAENHQLLISADYAGDAAEATWVDLPYNAVEGSDWNTFYKANVAVPAEFLGKNGVVFALRYTATTKAGTWEVKNFKVAHGKVEASEPETPEETTEYTVAEAIAALTSAAKSAIVKGYIVGTIKGQVYTEGCVFSGIAETMTNLLIADNPDETDYNNCMPVQLPSGKVRSALNLVDNPGNYKQLVTLTGSLEKYFGVAGLKSVKEYSFDGDAPAEPEQPEEPETPVEPETPEIVVGENILLNSGFEEWNGDVPTAWGKDGSNATAHNATIAQSTDADSGIYAVEVGGNANSNKRLASKAYTLPAGTYSLSAFIKQGGDAEGAFKLGYAIIKNGAIANGDYKYLHKEPVTATEEWEYYAVEFTLEEVTTVSVLVMNSSAGNGASILVDNVELVAQEATAVEVTVEDSDAVSVYYDLSGRVVKNPANGIYICNGKKVLVK